LFVPHTELKKLSRDRESERFGMHKRRLFLESGIPGHPVSGMSAGHRRSIVIFLFSFLPFPA
jgi:hypothetical protein